MPCKREFEDGSQCHGYVRKIPTINERDWMDDDLDYFRCDECGYIMDEKEYFGHE